MDQNIAESMVNSPDNKLMKGTSYHWDMFVVGCLNIPLSIFCMPWMHAVLPHSPLHVRALADIDEHVEEGHVYDIIVKVRETRVSNLVSNILIGISVHLIPRYIFYVPMSCIHIYFRLIQPSQLHPHPGVGRVVPLPGRDCRVGQPVVREDHPALHGADRLPAQSLHQEGPAA